MKGSFRHGTMVLALFGGMEVALAQLGSTPPELQDGVVGRGSLPTAPLPLKLTEEQKSAIGAAVSKENKTVKPPPSFVVQIGAPVPPAIELYILPDDALKQIPEAKSVKYTVVNNQLVLVDPTTMRVVDVVPKQ